MDHLILIFYILVLISLNAGAFFWFRKGKLNLIVSGFLMMMLAPLIGFSSGALVLHFYDWSSGGTGEGAGLAGAFLGLITLANGFLILTIGMILTHTAYRELR